MNIAVILLGLLFAVEAVAADTEVIVRVVGYGSMVLGDDVGGARVTITDVETGQILARGEQHGESGDQNQIMRTPRLMEEPRYSSKPSGAFRATLPLDKPTVVEIAAEGPLAYPHAKRRASVTTLLMPGRDLTNDGIVLSLYGFIVQVEEPKPGTSLMAKQDVALRASIRTMSGAWLRPHGDWDSRKVELIGEVMAGDRVLEKLQLVYAGKGPLFEAPFTVPTPQLAPNGVTIRVTAADRATGHFGVGKADFPVVPEQFKPAKKMSLALAADGPESGHRRPADLKQYLEHLDSAERDKDQKPIQVVEALQLKPGMAVADLGAGSGYFTRRFVEAVTEKGNVYAVDVETEMLAYVKNSLEHLHIPYTAQFILAQPDDPKLPTQSVDLIFLCNVYHHLEDRRAYFTRLRSALKPGGRIAVIDFYHDERSGNVGFPRRHLVPRETVIEEMAAAGYAPLREHTFLPRQYFMEFAAAPAAP